MGAFHGSKLDPPLFGPRQGAQGSDSDDPSFVWRRFPMARRDPPDHAGTFQVGLAFEHRSEHIGTPPKTSIQTPFVGPKPGGSNFGLAKGGTQNGCLREMP